MFLLAVDHWDSDGEVHVFFFFRKAEKLAFLFYFVKPRGGKTRVYSFVIKGSVDKIFVYKKVACFVVESHCNTLFSYKYFQFL